jgi:hypothetical protein
MKKTGLLLCVIASFITLINASLWEGAAVAALGGELPETGYYLATNSFPVNTVVDVTNLENGRTVRAIVSSGLENPGLLAVLSKDAAGAIALASRSLGRIRMTEPGDGAAHPRFTGRPGTSGDPDHDPAAFVAMNGYDPSLPAAGEASGTPNRNEGGEVIVDLPEDLPDSGTVSEPIPDNYELALVPAETRPPESGPEPDISQIIPGINPASPVPRDFAYIDPSLVIGPIKEAPETAAPYLSPPPAAPRMFSAPLISGLEKGKYYLQIAAYSKAETVQSEIVKIDSNLPVAIMNAGSAEKPIYRILIGPVNLGESGALLQRFRPSYKDAFVRLGS